MRVLFHLLSALVISAIAVGMPGTAHARADLVVPAVSNGPATVNPGDPAKFSFTVKNVGDARAGSTSAAVYVSRDRLRGSDRLLHAKSISALNPGGKVSKVYWANLPALLPLGYWYVIVCADSTRAVAEANESNNCRAASSRFLVKEQIAAPTDVVATPVSPSEVSVDWNTVTGATTYYIQRSTGGGAFSTVGTQGTNDQFVDDGLTAFTTYDYRVLAVDASGPSTASNVDDATTDRTCTETESSPNFALYLGVRAANIADEWSRDDSLCRGEADWFKYTLQDVNFFIPQTTIKLTPTAWGDSATDGDLHMCIRWDNAFSGPEKCSENAGSAYEFLGFEPTIVDDRAVYVKVYGATSESANSYVLDFTTSSDYGCGPVCYDPDDL